MKIITFILLKIYFLSFIFLFGSCENDTNELNNESNEHFVSQDELLSLLERPNSTSNMNTNSTKNNVEKNISFNR